MGDDEPPVFQQISGPKNGDRVKLSKDSILVSVTDDSGLDSLWWSLNGIPAGVPVKKDDNRYLIPFNLAIYGFNKVTLFARDNSSNKNLDSLEIMLNYDTEISCVTDLSPSNGGQHPE